MLSCAAVPELIVSTLNSSYTIVLTHLVNRWPRYAGRLSLTSVLESWSRSSMWGTLPRRCSLSLQWEPYGASCEGPAGSRRKRICACSGFRLLRCCMKCSKEACNLWLLSSVPHRLPCVRGCPHNPVRSAVNRKRMGDDSWIHVSHPHQSE